MMDSIDSAFDEYIKGQYAQRIDLVRAWTAGLPFKRKNMASAAKVKRSAPRLDEYILAINNVLSLRMSEEPIRKLPPLPPCGLSQHETEDHQASYECPRLALPGFKNQALLADALSQLYVGGKYLVVIIGEDGAALRHEVGAEYGDKELVARLISPTAGSIRAAICGAKIKSDAILDELSKLHDSFRNSCPEHHEKVRLERLCKEQYGCNYYERQFDSGEPEGVADLRGRIYQLDSKLQELFQEKFPTSPWYADAPRLHGEWEASDCELRKRKLDATIVQNRKHDWSRGAAITWTEPALKTTYATIIGDQFSMAQAIVTLGEQVRKRNLLAHFDAQCRVSLWPGVLYDPRIETR